PHRVARLCVEQEIFFFHPERVHARNNRSAGTLFRYHFWRKNGRRGVPRRPKSLWVLRTCPRQQLGLPQREVLTFSLSASRPTAPTTTLSPITSLGGPFSTV